jgi:hypothetical protein
VWDVFFCHERISMVDLRASLANNATGESSRRRARRIVTGGST